LHLRKGISNEYESVLRTPDTRFDLKLEGQVSGITYSFKVQARGTCGLGAQSEPLDVEFGAVPDKLEDMIPVIEKSKLCVSWALPKSTSPPVTGYKIEIEDGNGKYRELPRSECGKDPLVNKCCVVTSKLNGPPIFLNPGDRI
jgi:hypothetical protein